MKVRMPGRSSSLRPQRPEVLAGGIAGVDSDRACGVSLFRLVVNTDESGRLSSKE
jgi:hypothetical protein